MLTPGDQRWGSGALVLLVQSLSLEDEEKS